MSFLEHLRDNASVIECVNLRAHMQKALAQNPNLLRTLLGLSFSLIFLLGYAVYGATVSPSYYVYETDTTSTVLETNQPTKIYDDDENLTSWRWSFGADGTNLTWVNLTATQLSYNSLIKLTNSAGIYSHTKLGDSDAEDFNCEEKCFLNSTHAVISE